MKRPNQNSLVCWLSWAMTPTMLLAVSAIILLGLGIRDVGRVSAEARRLQACTLLARARIAADTAIRSTAAAPVYSAAAGTSVEVQLADLSIRLERTSSGVRAYLADLDGVGSFFAPWLDGAAAPAFSRSRISLKEHVFDSGLAWTPSSLGEWPCWYEPELARAKRADQRSGFRRDPSVALEHFAAGSDLGDYIWESCDEALPAVGAAGLLVVPGHLWLLSRTFPAGLHLQLEKDLVIVVEGNLYLGTSVRVSGPGRLLLAARAPGGATVFADLDGSGAWSSGDRRERGVEDTRPSVATPTPTPVEGCGAVWLGLSASRAALVCDAGIYADGAVHLKTSCTVRGPLLAARGVVALAKRAPLSDLLPGAQSGWTFDPGRDRIPGFKVRGRPRPGRLVFQER